MTMKFIQAEMGDIAVAALVAGVFMIGQPVVQSLPGRNAECENGQQYAGEKWAYDKTGVHK